MTPPARSYPVPVACAMEASRSCMVEVIRARVRQDVFPQPEAAIFCQEGAWFAVVNWLDDSLAGLLLPLFMRPVVTP